MNSVRYTSIDILRGLAITIMILGNLSPDSAFTYPQLLHRDWEGINLIDLAFPGFVFVMGVSLVFSHSVSGMSWFRKILRRSVLLFGLGLLLNHLQLLIMPLTTPDYTMAQLYFDLTANFRPMGVLQRLALVYLVGAFLYKIMPFRPLLWVSALGMMLCSTVGYHLYNSVEPYNQLNNLSSHIDQLLLGTSHIYLHGAFDPEGLWGTINASASIIMGLIVGISLKETPKSIFFASSPTRKLVATGLCMLALGWLWSNVEILGKPLWTAPYVLVTAGINTLVLAYLESRSEKRFIQGLLQPVRAIGRNPLFIYLFSQIMFILLVSFSYKGEPIYLWLYHTYLFNAASPFVSTFVYTLLWLLVCVILAEIMLRKNILIKL